jgi:transcription elongation factor Elf1
MSWLEIKYANQLGARLQRFKVKKNKPYIANFRCPYCGDSKTNKLKARGYFLEHKGSIVVVCHNCDVKTNLDKALQFLDPALHKTYVIEKLRERATESTTSTVVQSTFEADISKFAKRRFEKFEPLKKLKKVSQLPNEHIAKKYCVSRQIPFDKHFKLYYVPKFKQFTNELLPGKFETAEDGTLSNDSGRLLIPLIDGEGIMFGYQGRALNNDKIRYITIVLDESKPRLFGLDTVDYSKDIIVVEGPIDSLFVPNAIAMAGGDNGDIEKIGAKDKIIFCYDNEPRNKDTVKRMEKMIDKGYRVMIWPTAIVQKDINDMVLNGLSQEEISGIIYRNTYSGLMAKLKLQEWKKV